MPSRIGHAGPFQLVLHLFSQLSILLYTFRLCLVYILNANAEADFRKVQVSQ
jgi:hypothetical protein